MKLVILESPLRGNVDKNLHYARLAAADCVSRGESPYGSHLILTQFMDDEDPWQRATGMTLGWAWLTVADKVVVYQDLGVSDGMKQGIDEATRLGVPIEYRSIVSEEGYAAFWNMLKEGGARVSPPPPENLLQRILTFLGVPRPRK